MNPLNVGFTLYLFSHLSVISLFYIIDLFLLLVGFYLFFSFFPVMDDIVCTVDSDIAFSLYFQLDQHVKFKIHFYGQSFGN